MKLELKTAELSKVESSKADQIKSTFLPMADMLEAFESRFNDVVNESELSITPETIAKAKRLRLDIAQVRLKTEEVRKEQKNQYLIAGRAIDGVANILKWAVSEKEQKLAGIEMYFINLRALELKELQEKRVNQISKYINDAHERDLGSMDEDVWKAYFVAKKQAYTDQIEAEKKAEKDRIERIKAEKLERERIEKENAKLKKEAQERSKKEAEERAERAKIEQIRLKKDAEQRSKQEAALRAEREKREAIQKELEKREQAEAEKKRADEEREQEYLNRGDLHKLSDLIKDLRDIQLKYSFKSKKNQAKMDDVKILIDKVISHIQK